MGRHAFRLAVEGEMTVPLVEELKEAILPVIAHSWEIEIDLSQVSRIDCAGLLLLMAVKLEAITWGRDLYFIGHSEPVMEMLGLWNLDRLFNAPAATVFARSGSIHSEISKVH